MKPSDPDGRHDIHLPESLWELMRNFYREALGAPPSDDAVLEFALFAAMNTPEAIALTKDAGTRPDSERQLIRSFLDRHIEEAVAKNASTVDTGIDGPVTNDAILAKAKKIRDN